MRHPAVWGVLVLLSACNPPPAGILTLAPAGMAASPGVQANPDGSANLAAGASLASSAYIGAGSVSIVLTATALEQGPSHVIQLFVDGTRVGEMTVSASAAASQEFPLRFTEGRPHTLRLEVSSPSRSAANNPVLRLEKVVVRQP